LKKVVKTLVLPQEKTHLKEIEGLARPDFVFLNWGDHAYAKVLLDPHSTALALEDMGKLDSNLLRQLLWGTFYHMVRDAKLKSTDFLNLVKKQIPFENDLKLVQSVWRSAEASLANFLPDSIRIAEFESMFEFCLKMLEQAKVQDAQITWARALIFTAQTPKNVGRLLQFMDKCLSFPFLFVYLFVCLFFSFFYF
jgi:aminopeptidase N